MTFAATAVVSSLYPLSVVSVIVVVSLSKSVSSVPVMVTVWAVCQSLVVNVNELGLRPGVPFR